MPRAWYKFMGLQTVNDYDDLSNYELIDGEPTCSSGDKICAVYAAGSLIAGTPPTQSFNPTDIDFVRTLFAEATGSGVNQSVGGRLYVRVQDE